VSGVAFNVNNAVDGQTYVMKRVRLVEGDRELELEALFNEPRPP
jgi:hypothetical protein